METLQDSLVEEVTINLDLSVVLFSWPKNVQGAAPSSGEPPSCLSEYYVGTSQGAIAIKQGYACTTLEQEDVGRFWLGSSHALQEAAVEKQSLSRKSLTHRPGRASYPFLDCAWRWWSGRRGTTDCRCSHDQTANAFGLLDSGRVSLVHLPRQLLNRRSSSVHPNWPHSWLSPLLIAIFAKANQNWIMATGRLP